MSKWKSKPTVIEAFQWTGGPDQTEDPVWIVEAIREGDVVFRENLDERCVEMRVTSCMDTWLYAKPGDWVVKGLSKNRFSVVSDADFRANYEPAEPTARDLKDEDTRRQFQSEAGME